MLRARSRKRPKDSFVRFERPGPMQLWQMDIVGGIRLVSPVTGPGSTLLAIGPYSVAGPLPCVPSSRTPHAASKSPVCLEGRALAVWNYRRRAGSCSAWCRCSASTDTRAYLTSERTDVCPLRAMSMGADVPSSASWVSAECRSWCRVAPLLAARNSASACE